MAIRLVKALTPPIKTKQDYGVFVVNIYVGNGTKEGRRVTQRITGKRSDAEALERRMKVDLDREEAPDSGDMPFGVAFDKFLKVKKQTIERTTYDSYVYYKKMFVDFFGEKTQLRKITRLACEEYFASKMDPAQTNNKPLSGNTLKKQYFILRAFFEMVYSIEKNPMRNVAPPEKEKYVATCPTREELAIMVENVKDDDFRSIILLAAWCGLREGEICALTPQDFDLKNKTLRIDESMARAKKEDGTGYEHYIKDPKSDNSYRTITIAPRVIELIQPKLRECSKLNAPIFDIQPASLSRKFNRLIHGKLGPKEARTKGRGTHWESQNALVRQTIRFHDLRHYHATEMFDAGISDEYAAMRLGDNINTLKVVYQHLREKRVKKEDAAVVKMIQKS